MIKNAKTLVYVYDISLKMPTVTVMHPHNKLYDDFDECESNFNSNCHIMR